MNKNNNEFIFDEDDDEEEEDDETSPYCIYSVHQQTTESYSTVHQHLYKNNYKIYLDTCTSDNICGIAEFFVPNSFETIQGTIKTLTNSTPVTQKGLCNIWVYNPLSVSIYKLLLSDTRYIPNTDITLISVGKAVRKGFKYMQDGTFAYMYDDNGKCMLVAKLQENNLPLVIQNINELPSNFKIPVYPSTSQ